MHKGHTAVRPCVRAVMFPPSASPRKRGGGLPPPRKVSHEPLKCILRLFHFLERSPVALGCPPRPAAAMGDAPAAPPAPSAKTALIVPRMSRGLVFAGGGRRSSPIHTATRIKPEHTAMIVNSSSTNPATKSGIPVQRAITMCRFCEHPPESQHGCGVEHTLRNLQQIAQCNA